MEIPHHKKRGYWEHLKQKQDGSPPSLPARWKKAEHLKERLEPRHLGYYHLFHFGKLALIPRSA
jgi:hypothetical protein